MRAVGGWRCRSAGRGPLPGPYSLVAPVRALERGGLATGALARSSRRIAGHPTQEVRGCVVVLVEGRTARRAPDVDLLSEVDPPL